MTESHLLQDSFWAIGTEFSFMVLLCGTHILLTVPCFSHENYTNYGSIQVIEEFFGLSDLDLLFNLILSPLRKRISVSLVKLPLRLNAGHDIV